MLSKNSEDLELFDRPFKEIKTSIADIGKMGFENDKVNV